MQCVKNKNSYCLDEKIFINDCNWHDMYLECCLANCPQLFSHKFCGRARILTVVEQNRDCAPVYFHVVVSQVHSIQVLHPSGLGVDRLF